MSSSSRFEIQEMLSHSEQGVTYLARDRHTERMVAIKRFFPYGRNGGGLEGEDRTRYENMCQRLRSVTHRNLRSVIEGGVDSIDGIPYLVSTWLDGPSLSELTEQIPMEAAQVVDLVKQCLELSVVLSEAMDEPGIWVDVRPNSIIVAENAYSFQVSSVACLGTGTKQREVRSIAVLAKELMGWNSKLYSVAAAGGFGGWIKEIEGSSTMTPQLALSQLNALLAAEPSVAEATAHAPQAVALGALLPASRQATASAAPTSVSATQAMRQRPMTMRKAPRSKRPMVLVAVCVAAAIALGMWIHKNQTRVRARIAKVEAAGAAKQAATTKAAITVTDFSNFVESGNFLGEDNNREQSFTSSGADVTIDHVSGGGAGQEFYLSSEFDTLAAGHRISVDLTSSSSTTFEQFGLALTNTTTPGPVQVIWAWRHADDLQLTIRDGDGHSSSDQITSTTAFPDTLFIDRTATGWSFGSISSSVETVHFANITVSPTNPNASIEADGTTIGFFSDMRSNATPKTLSNLTIGEVPLSNESAVLSISQ